MTLQEGQIDGNEGQVIGTGEQVDHRKYGRNGKGLDLGIAHIPVTYITHGTAHEADLTVYQLYLNFKRLKRHRALPVCSPMSILPVWFPTRQCPLAPDPAEPVKMWGRRHTAAVP